MAGVSRTSLEHDAHLVNLVLTYILGLLTERRTLRVHAYTRHVRLGEVLTSA
jgi:hypothetical protein